MSKEVKIVNPDQTKEIIIDEVAEPAILAKTPKSEQELRPWGTIIHWPEIKHIFLTNVSKPYYQWRVPVTCGVCGKRRECRLYRVTEVEALSEENLSDPKGYQYTGICRDSGHPRKYFGDQTLPSGSVIHWSKREKGKVPITCGKCKQERFANDQSGSLTGKRLRDEYKGYCSSCARNELNIDEIHPSGSIIHWGERETGLPKNSAKVKITCHGCGQKKFVRVTFNKQIRNEWSGLCSDCIRKRPSPKKFTHDEHLPSGSVIHWSERDPSNRNRIMVTCGLPTCGKKHLTHIQQTEGQRSKNFTGFCPKHNLVEIALLLQNKLGNEVQKNGSTEKRKRGRKQGNKYIDPKASLSSLKNAIRTLRQQSTAISDITYGAVAEVFQYSGEQIGADAVRKRYNECNTGMKWRDFVVSEASQNGN
jgi:hypothetical protein